VKFVSPKGGDSVAVVARSVEKDATVEEAVEEAILEAGESEEPVTPVDGEIEPAVEDSATIDPDRDPGTPTGTDIDDEPGADG